MTYGGDDVGMQRTLLVGDIVFSASCGAAFTLFASPLGRWAEVPPFVVLVVGLLILGHVGVLAVGAARPPLAGAVTRYAVVANLGWVAVAVVVLIADWLTGAAASVFAVLSAIVGLFGALQWRTMR